MCHLLLAMPVLALVVFWLWPLWIAAPIYAVVVLLSGVVYLKMLQAMKRPGTAGLDDLVQSAGQVVAVQGNDIRVLVHGEHWSAHSPDTLQVGDPVRVTGVEGLTLEVRRSGSDVHAPSGPGPAERRGLDGLTAPR